MAFFFTTPATKSGSGERGYSRAAKKAPAGGDEQQSIFVMYVVDMQWALYYQKCYDPDCKGYRSPSRPIPLEVIPETFGSGQSETNQKNATNSPIKSVTESPCNENWWHEAAKIADIVENSRNLSEAENCALGEDYEEWWAEVERNASESELSLLSLNNVVGETQS